MCALQLPDRGRADQRARRTVALVRVPLPRHGAHVPAHRTAEGDSEVSDDNDTTATPTIEIKGDRVFGNGMVIGTIIEEEFNLPDGYRVEPVIVLNAAWCKMADVHVRVLDDPEVDHHRDGRAFDR
jgi:hypothetical protein